MEPYMIHRSRSQFIARACVLLLVTSQVVILRAEDNFDRDHAMAALRKSVDFYRSHVGYHGAYLYRYSEDLSKQEGEHEAYRTTGWTQPPGTPTVGATYLDAFLLTGEEFLLEAAREVAEALLLGQLESGGWYFKFELGAEHRRQYAYRIEPNNPRGRNNTTLDDNKSQSALMFLMHMDEELEHKDLRINEAVRYALSRLAAAQFPNGAWPQQFSQAPNPQQHRVVKASYPEKWSRTFANVDYRAHYTLNDNAIADTIDVMLEGARIYEDSALQQAAERAGDFIVLAQMPEPQPGWSQQYDEKMQPAWARKFEPPAVTGGESQGAMRSLLKLYDATGEERFLAPLPSAIAYYRRSLLPDGQLARFYELRTNAPLYFTKDYVLTYNDEDMPTHYSFKVSSDLDAIEQAYRRLENRGASRRGREWRPQQITASESLRDEARRVVDSADPRGAWLETGELRTYPDDDRETRVITMRTYVENLTTLSRYVASSDGH
jgi:PelA/Pel-15E family pectate lyase